MGTLVYHARAQTTDCCGVGGYNATELALNLVVDTILHAVSCVSWRNFFRVFLRILVASCGMRGIGAWPNVGCDWVTEDDVMRLSSESRLESWAGWWRVIHLAGLCVYTCTI